LDFGVRLLETALDFFFWSAVARNRFGSTLEKESNAVSSNRTPKGSIRAKQEQNAQVGTDVTMAKEFMAFRAMPT
jgi:hypothetical protein